MLPHGGPLARPLSQISWTPRVADEDARALLAGLAAVDSRLAHRRGPDADPAPAPAGAEAAAWLRQRAPHISLPVGYPDAAASLEALVAARGVMVHLRLDVPALSDALAAWLDRHVDLIHEGGPPARGQWPLTIWLTLLEGAGFPALGAAHGQALLLDLGVDQRVQMQHPIRGWPNGRRQCSPGFGFPGVRAWQWANGHGLQALLPPPVLTALDMLVIARVTRAAARLAGFPDMDVDAGGSPGQGGGPTNVADVGGPPAAPGRAPASPAGDDNDPLAPRTGATPTPTLTPTRAAGEGIPSRGLSARAPFPRGFIRICIAAPQKGAAMQITCAVRK